MPRKATKKWEGPERIFATMFGWKADKGIPPLIDYSTYVRADTQTDTREAALREAAALAENRYKEWNDESGVSCDATACENISAGILSLIGETE